MNKNKHKSEKKIDSKICIYTRKNLKNSYSCILYLKNCLEQKTRVVLWSNTTRDEISEIYSKNVHSFRERWYGKFKGVRVILAKLQCFLDLLYGEKTVIIQDLDFFIPAYYAKKVNKRLIIIHYNTEIHGNDVPYPKYITEFYKKRAGFPDMIIECLKERAQYREKKFKIKKQIYVINNTLPLRSLKIDEEIDEKLLDYPRKLPILIYAGGCNTNRGLTTILESLNELKDVCNVLLFLYGDSKEIDSIREDCKKLNCMDMCHISNAVNREKLFAYMRKCDIGLNYYVPEISINHRYAAPSKFFEYLAMGLRVISTNNIGINRIIENEKVGVCIHKGDSLASSVRRLLSDKELKNKNEIMKLFREKYCYEIDAKIAIKRIYDLIS